MSNVQIITTKKTFPLQRFHWAISGTAERQVKTLCLYNASLYYVLKDQQLYMQEQQSRGMQSLIGQKEKYIFFLFPV